MMTMEEAQGWVDGAVSSACRVAGHASRRTALVLDGSSSVYAEVRDGREPRGLPLHGEHALNRLGQELDRERARLVIVFEVSGKINGVDHDKVRVWIQGSAITLPTLWSGTDAARRILYGMAERVLDSLRPRLPEIMAVAWDAHLAGLADRVADRQLYLAAIQARITDSVAKNAHGRTLTVTAEQVKSW